MPGLEPFAEDALSANRPLPNIRIEAVGKHRLSAEIKAPQLKIVIQLDVRRRLNPRAGTPIPCLTLSN